MLDASEVSKHNSRASCWVVVSGQAYDVTDFIDSHPGGSNIILRYAGKDATKEYEPVHPPGTIEKTLDPSKLMGPVIMPSASESRSTKEAGVSSGTKTIPLSTCQNLNDFEREAKKQLSRKAWVFYDSAAESLSSSASNNVDWAKISFRPRILRNVARISMRRTIMGQKSRLPFFIAPAAAAKLGHKDGELCLARGAAHHDIPYCVSTYSSASYADLATCLKQEAQGGVLLFQLYVPIVKENAKKLVAQAIELGYKALVITVDCAVVGKREEDDRYKAELDHEAGVETTRTTNPDPRVEAPILRGAHSSTLDWDDLSWIRAAWGKRGPVVLKGIQTAEDALLACQMGIDGIYLSNHGGRQLDFAPSAIKTLLEIRRFYPEVLEKMEVYLDGGVRRGTDILKALSLGATAVGLGRPFMYALSAYGTEGVIKAIQLLSDEIETSMRLLGITDLSQLNDYYVNTSVLERELTSRIDLSGSNISSKL